MGLKPKHAKFQRLIARETFPNSLLNGRVVEKTCDF